MSRVRTFVELSPIRQWLFVQAVGLLWLTKLGFRLGGFRRTERTLRGILLRITSDSAATSDVRWSVLVASRYVSSTTCLERAVVAHALCQRYGHDSELYVGVAPDSGEFLAHSWVECDDAIVVGDDVDLDRYEPLGVIPR